MTTTTTTTTNSRMFIHVTRIGNGSVYGHDTDLCGDDCGGIRERFIGGVAPDAVDVGSSYEISEDGSVIAELKEFTSTMREEIEHHQHHQGRLPHSRRAQPVAGTPRQLVSLAAAALARLDG